MTQTSTMGRGVFTFLLSWTGREGRHGACRDRASTCRDSTKVYSGRREIQPLCAVMASALGQVGLQWTSVGFSGP